MGDCIDRLLTGPAYAKEPVSTVWWRDQQCAKEKRRRQPVDSLIEATAERSARGQWANDCEFVLSCIGFSVGLGNIWRFPYLAYENGGAAFLIAYVTLQLVLGNPLYMMELLVGQFSGKGPIQVWDMNPAAKGVGVSMVVTSAIIIVYYNVIMAYGLYYLFASMQETMPWTQCKSEWVGKYNCIADRKSTLLPCSADIKAMKLEGNCKCTGNSAIDDVLPFLCTTERQNGTNAAELYFYKTVLQRPDDVNSTDIGTPILALTICLFISTVLVTVGILNGIRSSGKISYFTVSYPYIMVLIMLVRVAHLEGASDGIRFFLVPDFEKLLETRVWSEAAGQVFFSLSLANGPIMLYGSYNKFWTTRAYSYAIFIATMDLVASLLCGLFVFSTFGILAKRFGSSIEGVALSDNGLAFVLFPEALSHMEPTQLWAIFFYLMIFTLGIDTQFSYVETLRSCLMDEIPSLRYYNSLILFAIGASVFIFGLPCVCPGGDYLVTLLDHYGSTLPSFFIAFFEIISIMWVYGCPQFVMDMDYMCGRRLPLMPFFVFCWVIATPLIILCLLAYRIKYYEPPKYSTGEFYPQIATAVGYCLFAIALCPIPFVFLRRLYHSYEKRHIKTARDRLRYLFSLNRHWVPNDGRPVLPPHSTRRREKGQQAERVNVEDTLALSKMNYISQRVSSNLKTIDETAV